MSKEAKVVLMVFLAVALDRLCTLVPSGIYFDPFPFYDLTYCDPCTGKCANVGINMQYFCKAITVHIGWVLFMVAFSCAFESTKKLFLLFAFLEALSIIDFWLIYEQAFYRLPGIAIELTDIKNVILYPAGIYLWKTHRL